MKKWLLLFALAIPAYGQISNPGIVTVSTAPSGACSSSLPDWQTYPGGLLYSCQSGTWTQIAGGGGGGGVSSFSAGNLVPLFTTSVATATTTPALTFTITAAAANTVFGNFTGSSGSPSYNSVPSCSGGTNALTYTLGSGFGCNTITGGVSSVSNSDSSLTISPTTGSVVVSLNLSNPNIFTANQTAPAFIASGTTNGNIGLTSTGSSPSAAPTSTIQVEAPNSVTAYRVILPGVVATANSTYLSCTAASPSVCSWASAVAGPSSSTNGGLVLWNGTTGQVAQDAASLLPTVNGVLYTPTAGVPAQVSNVSAQPRILTQSGNGTAANPPIWVSYAALSGNIISPASYPNGTFFGDAQYTNGTSWASSSSTVNVCQGLGIVPTSTSGGTGYSGSGTATVNGGTSTVAATVTVAAISGSLQFTVTNPGCYTVIPTSVTFSGFTGGSGATVPIILVGPTFVAGDVGKKAYGTGACTVQVKCTLQVPVGTITAVANAYQATVSTTSTAAASSTGATNVAHFFWGHDDSPALLWAAGQVYNTPGAIIQLPCGKMFFDQPVFRFLSPHPSNGIGLTGCTIGGQPSVLIGTPDFAYTASQGILFYDAYAGGNSTQIASEDYLANVFFYGSDIGTISGIASNSSLLYLYQAFAVNLWVTGWGYTTTNLNCLNSAGALVFENGGCNVSGNVGFLQSANSFGSGSQIYSSFFGGNNTFGLQVTGGDISTFAAPPQSAISMNSSTSHWSSNGDLGMSQLTCTVGNVTFNGSAPLSVTNNGCNVIIQNDPSTLNFISVSGTSTTTISNTNISETTFPALNITGGSSTIIDQGGNSYATTGTVTIAYLGPSTGTFISNDNVPAGCTGTLTASVTIFLYSQGQTGPCTLVTQTVGQRMSHPGTFRGLWATAGTVGVGPDSVTVYKNGTATSMTCNLGTILLCSDDLKAHEFTFAMGDVISYGVATSVLDTLANLNAGGYANYK